LGWRSLKNNHAEKEKRGVSLILAIRTFVRVRILDWPASRQTGA